MADASNEKKEIFIVDDDVELVDMLLAFFARQDYEVRTTMWGEEAIRKISERRPDVVLLDIWLPDTDGYEVCRRLRQSRRTRHLPVIFLTKRHSQKDKLAGLELGAVDYITKPFDVHELALRIRNALRRADLQPLHNPVTELPEGTLVQEQLEALLQRPTWGLIFASIQGLNHFRDQYGFVAADDVRRAMSLMISKAMKEIGAARDFLGHVSAEEFVVITDLLQCEKLAKHCHERLESSIPFFYAAADRDQYEALTDAERLSVQVKCLTSRDGNFGNVAELGEALAQMFA